MRRCNLFVVVVLLIYRSNFRRRFYYRLQIYATIGAFYLPLTVMIVIYVRIFLVSSRIARAEALSKPSFDASVSLSSSRQLHQHDVIGNSCSTSRLLLSQQSAATPQQQLFASHISQAINNFKTTRELTDIKTQPTDTSPGDSTPSERFVHCVCLNGFNLNFFIQIKFVNEMNELN